MIYAMICPKCDHEVEWNCTVKEYESKIISCPACHNAVLQQDYTKKNMGFTVDGFSYKNGYCLK